MIKFSLILPIHFDVNYKTFKKSFDSLMRQTLKPTEYVIVLDGPIKPIILGYMNTFLIEKNVKIIKNIKNIGLGKSLNKAILKCNYEIIIRADSDVIYDINRNKEFILFYKKNKNIDIFGSWMSEVDSSNKIYIKKTPVKNKAICFAMNFRNPINHPTVMFKKKKIISAGNYKHMPFFEDYYLWLRCKKIGINFLNIKKNLALTNIDLGYIKRRDGIPYFINFLEFQKNAYEEKLISGFFILANILIRLSILPFSSKIKLYIYKKFLRS